MAQLTRDDILDAAVALIDDGPTALTMRALADRLGVTGAALYYWFPAKGELLDAVAAHLAERIIAEPDPDAAWQDRVRAIAAGVVRSADAHPGAFTWVFTTYAKRPPLSRIDEALLEVLLGAGFDLRGALVAKGAFWRFLVGHLGLATVPSHIDPTTVDVETHPRIHEVAAVSASLDGDDYFAGGLDLLIAGLTVMLG